MQNSEFGGCYFGSCITTSPSLCLFQYCRMMRDQILESFSHRDFSIMVIGNKFDLIAESNPHTQVSARVEGGFPSPLLTMAHLLISVIGHGTHKFMFPVL